MPKIVDYQIYKLDIPLKRPFVTSIRSSKSLKGIVCEVILADGQVGFGESAENVKLTGESRADMSRFIKDFFDEHLNGEAEDILLSLQSFANHSAARYGMEIAILDAVAKDEDEEISSELGIDVKTRQLMNDTTISLMDSAATIRETKRVLAAGYQRIKFKVGHGNSEIQRILQLADVIPANISVRIDPNQSWNYQEALDAIQAFDESSLQVEFIEQPFNLLMVDKMKQLALKTNIPIIADESVFTLEDAKRVIENGYGTAINIKLIKCGGPLEAIEIANFAKRKGINCLLGCTTESNIALTTAAYLSAGLDNVKYNDLDGLDYIVDTPFSGGIIDQNGEIEIPKQQNGLGISIAKQQYLTKY